MTKPIKIGLIGAGRIGKLHAENLALHLPQADLVAISDIHLPSAQQYATTYNIPLCTDDYRRMLDDEQLEAVVICSNTDTHAQIIRDAAQAQKHIFCEKPIALDLPTIDDALHAVEQHGVKLQLGFNRRFDPSFQEARDLIAAGKIGTPHLVRITSRDPAPPPLTYINVSGGLFLDMAIHDFDMARFLIADEIVELFAAAANLVDPAIGEAGDIDTAITTLRYQSGAIGTIDNSRRAVYGYDQRVEVFGSEGQVLVGNHTAHNAILSNAGGIHGPLPHYFFLERYAESFLAEMRAFLQALVDDTPPPVSGLDGRIPVVMALAAAQSVRENRPIKLSQISD